MNIPPTTTKSGFALKTFVALHISYLRYIKKSLRPLNQYLDYMDSYLRANERALNLLVKLRFATE